MRKNMLLAACIFSICFSAAAIFAQADKKDEIPPGMELLEVKPGLKQIVPKGTKVTKIGDLIALEDINEYMARRFEGIGQLLSSYGLTQEALRKDLDELLASNDQVLTGFRKDIEGKLAEVSLKSEDNKKGQEERLDKIESAQDNFHQRLEGLAGRQEELANGIERMKDVLLEMRETLEEAKEKK